MSDRSPQDQNRTALVFCSWNLLQDGRLPAKHAQLGRVQSSLQSLLAKPNYILGLQEVAADTLEWLRTQVGPERLTAEQYHESPMFVAIVLPAELSFKMASWFIPTSQRFTDRQGAPQRWFADEKPAGRRVIIATVEIDGLTLLLCNFHAPIAEGVRGRAVYVREIREHVESIVDAFDYTPVVFADANLYPVTGEFSTSRNIETVACWESLCNFVPNIVQASGEALENKQSTSWVGWPQETDPTLRGFTLDENQDLVWSLEEFTGAGTFLDVIASTLKLREVLWDGATRRDWFKCSDHLPVFASFDK